MSAAYYAFVLEALDRFGREGVRVAGPPRLPFLSLKPAILDAAITQVQAAGGEGPILEFGLWKGRSLRRLARAFPGRRVYGFDSFQGFPDDGRADWRKDLTTPRPGRLPANAGLVEGFFADTLPGFLAGQPNGRLDLIHIDCDLYSSTRDVLTALGERLAQGTVIVFDELLNYRRFLENELLALFELVEARGLDFEWLATAGDACSLEVQLGPDALKGPMKAFRARGYYQNAAIRLVVDRDRAQRTAPFREQAARLAAMRPLRQPLAALS